MINLYSKWATEHMEIDMDDSGLYCKVCSERHEHVRYTVHVDESGLVPVATSCNCPASKHCKHMQIVNAFYARIYKSNTEKAQLIAQHVETPAQPVETPKVTDISTKGNLNGAQRAAGLLMELPSRKALAG